MANTMKARLVVRHDTTENWTNSDPILLHGEIAYDETNNYLKVGDGSAKWSELPEIGGAAAEPYTLPIATESELGGVKIAKTKTDETVKVAIDTDGTLYVPAGGSGYSLPIATSAALGGVLSSEDQDYVQVEADGKMKLNKISATLLVNETADDFVLDGGTAAA